MEGLRSSELANQGGVNLETIRYYERRGLLPKPPRTSAGYRAFDAEAVRRLLFIKQAQALGFSLKEVRELLALRLNPRTSCADVRRRAEARSGAPPADRIACALVAAKRRERPSRAARALAALAAAIALVRLASPAGWLAVAESISAASSAGTVAIPIEGMTCASCAAQVKKALRALDGVSDVEVSLE